MNIGRMDRRITLKAVTSTKDSKGGTVKTRSTLDVVWATIKYPKGMSMNEGEEAGVETAIKTAEFTIRYRTDVNETIEVDYQSQTYDVKRVEEIGRKEGLRLVTDLRV